MPRNGSASTRNDIILIFVLLACAGLLFVARYFYYGGAADSSLSQSSVLVTVDGEEQGRYSLVKDDEISIKGQNWTNTLLIKDGKVSMIKADCPDKICVHHSAISKRGENIVCLPHKVVVEIIAGEQDKEEGFDGIVQ